MKETEKTTLLKDGAVNSFGQDKQTEAATPLRSVHYAFIPITMVLFTTYSNSFYMISQWIPHYVRTSYQVGTAGIDTSGCESNNHSDQAYKQYKTVEQETARWATYYSLAASLPSCLSGPIFLAYSDALGRRCILIICSSVGLLKNIFYSLCIYYSLELKWVALSTAFESLFGSIYVIIAVFLSCASDTTSPGRARSQGLTIAEALLLVSITAGGVLSGYVVQYSSFFTLSWTNTLAALICWVIILLFLPETHAVENRTPTVSIWGNYGRMIAIYTSSAFKKKRAAYILLIATFFFDEITYTQRSAIEIIYQLGQPFCWSNGKVGLFSAARHATQGLAGVTLIGPLKRCLSDVVIAIGSAVFCCGSYVLEGLATTDLQLYCVPILGTFSFLSLSMIKSMMSSLTPVDQQGSLFASISLVQTLCSVAATLIQNNVYSATVNFFNGFVFLLQAGICLVVVVLLLVIAKTQKQTLVSSIIKTHAKVND